MAFLAKLCMYNTMSITGSNVQVLMHFLMNNGNVIVELIDCMYGLSNCGLS